RRFSRSAIVACTTPFRSAERECADLSLVLTARGIEHRQLGDTRGHLLLVVPASSARAAGEEIAAYRSEHAVPPAPPPPLRKHPGDRKSTRLNSSHVKISY